MKTSTDNVGHFFRYYPEFRQLTHVIFSRAFPGSLVHDGEFLGYVANSWDFERILGMRARKSMLSHNSPFPDAGEILVYVANSWGSVLRKCG